MNEKLAELVERLWVTNAHVTFARLDDVARGLDAIAAGEPVDVPHVTGQAHVLAGSLGMYGRPGSDLLKQAEAALLAGVTPATAAALAAEVRALAAGLERPTAS